VTKVPKCWLMAVAFWGFDAGARISGRARVLSRDGQWQGIGGGRTDLELQCGKPVLGDVSRRYVEGLGCGFPFVGLGYVVEDDVQAGCQLPDRRDLFR